MYGTNQGQKGWLDSDLETPLDSLADSCEK